MLTSRLSASRVLSQISPQKPRRSRSRESCDVIPRRCAGILIPLFSLRSAGDFGRGDIGGLAAVGDLALAMGQRLIQLLPIDETPPGETRPYSAMSGLAIDPRYIPTAQHPGADPARGRLA